MKLILSLLFTVSTLLNGGLAAVLFSSKKPAVVMVPGAFHIPQTFEKVVSRLDKADYKFLDAVALPSVGHVVGRDADTEAVRKILKSHLDAGRDVVLVGNSYGCTVIGEAVKGLKSSQYEDNTASSSTTTGGRIISLVYLAGYIPTIAEVENPETKVDIHGLSPIFNFHDNNGTVTADADLVHYPPQQAFYNLLPTREADFWTKKLNFSSFDALNATATYIPYMGDFKVVYVVGSEDRAVSPEMAQAYIDQPRAKFTVERIKADHISMLSEPDKVTEIIKKYSTHKAA